MKYNISIKLISKILLVFSTIFIIVAPLLNILRMNVLKGTIVLFGRYYFINEFYVLWLFLLFILFAFIFVSIVFGRVYCGFICPQTILSQIFEGLFDFIKKRTSALSKPVIYAAVLIFMAILSLFIGFNLIAYFIPPSLVIKHAFFEPDYLTPYLWVIAGFVTLLIIFDMALLRHKYCIYACPYGFIQFLFNDSRTLRILYRPADNNLCKDCTDCADSCFMKIDPRKKALQVQCVNCGYCIDACRERFDSKRETGKNLFYSFGLDEDKKNKSKNRPFFYKASIALFLLIGSFIIFLAKFSNYHYLNQSIFNMNQAFIVNNKMIANKYKLIVENASDKSKKLKIKLVNSELNLHFFSSDHFEIKPHNSLTLYPVLYIVNKKNSKNFKKGPYPVVFQIVNSKNAVVSAKNTIFFITKKFNNKK
ncbi:MAG: 4Fe-4S binding protein [Deltaproteobacteria bacterium]|jgi:polyferredoxin|nr:4Fe-4S binding protein [Deltaproteobacteria bacterium]MCL5879966.1 4Fe-4S binding protein [Deltaproteobacteria bacterium]MDA8304367.1 4Fe-4S binding protein [Deltaproteobacteria bacterium]